MKGEKQISSFEGPLVNNLLATDEALSIQNKDSQQLPNWTTDGKTRNCDHAVTQGS